MTAASVVALSLPSERCLVLQFYDDAEYWWWGLLAAAAVNVATLFCYPVQCREEAEWKHDESNMSRYAKRVTFMR